MEKKLSKGEVKSFNGCKVQWYRIGTQEKKENVGSFGDIFVDALAYAYKHDTQGFLRIKERAESTLKDKHRRLFVIEENKNPHNWKNNFLYSVCCTAPYIFFARCIPNRP